MELINVIEQQFGVELSVKAVLNNSTPAALAKIIDVEHKRVALGNEIEELYNGMEGEI